MILSCFVCGLFAAGTVADGVAFLSPIVGSNPGVTIKRVSRTELRRGWVNHGFAVLNDEGRLRADLRAASSAASGSRAMDRAPGLKDSDPDHDNK